MLTRLLRQAGVIGLGFILALVTAPPAPAQGRRPPDADRDARDTARVIDALGVRAGDTVAEIGAGSGSLAIAVARHVGERGRVYASELGENRVGTLKRAVSDAGISNIVVLDGDERVSNLPASCCDGVFMRNVYHHFADPASMDDSLLRALKPGGRLVVMDFAPPSEAGSPEGRDEGGHHGVSAEAIGSELRRAGFEVLQSESDAIGEGRAGDRGVFVLARKPAP